MDRIAPATGWATVDCGNARATRRTLNEIIETDDEQAWWNDLEVSRHWDMMFERHQRQVDALRAQGGGPFVMTAFRRVRQGQQRMEVRFDGVAGCLRTPRGGSAKQIVIVLDCGEVRMRWMTPREYARLQGAGDFVLPENTIQALFGFGDAVCMPVIEWIDRNMLTPVFEAAQQRGALRSEDSASRLTLAVGG
jgi:DNA (cytosine-5)-methyltransferase 1